MSSRQPVKISVIMPVYNTERYVKEAVESVLAQKHASFELLIGDDGSQDKSWGEIQRYRHHPRVKMWKFLRNFGPATARNNLLAQAKGRYIAFFDSDDRLLPDYLKTLSKILDDHPRLGVVYSDLTLIGAQGQHLRTHRVVGQADRWDLLGCPVWAPGTMVRKIALDKVGGFRRGMRCSEDIDLFFRLAEVASFYHHKGPPLYLYRQHARSTHSRYSKKVLQTTTRDILRRAIFRRYGFRVNW